MHGMRLLDGAFVTVQQTILASVAAVLIALAAGRSTANAIAIP